MTANVLLWLYGLGTAVIGAGASSITVMIVDPNDFNLTTGWRKLAAVSLVNGVVAGAAYLKQQPLPAWDGIDRRGTR
jgi:hypothetical protein